jgi:hypothetical protein
MAPSAVLFGLAAICNAPIPPSAQMESFSFATALPACALQRYDWSRYIVMPPKTQQRMLEPDAPRGSQVNRFATANHYYGDSPKAVAFVQAFMPSAISLCTDSHTLLYGALLALATSPDGVAIDLGANVFKSSNLIGSVFSQNTVFACDTFSGLPLAWIPNESLFPAGTYALRVPLEDRQPPFPVLDNVIILRGPFSETVKELVPLLAETPVALIHINSLSYENAVDGLRPLLPLLRVGTVLAFDTFYNYPNYEKGEYRAFTELIANNGFKFVPVAYNAYHQQVVIQITRLP